MKGGLHNFPLANHDGTANYLIQCKTGMEEYDIKGRKRPVVATKINYA